MSFGYSGDTMVANGGYKNDIWQSSNGVDWTEVMAGSHWSARNSHQVVVKEDVFWLFGGYDGWEL